jgi:uncharacterized membrane protein YhaH (DUF805 family)
MPAGFAMSERAERFQLWLGVLCGIAVVAVVIMVAPHLFAESARAARPFGAVALRSLVWIVIAVAAYWALVHAPAGGRRALASGRSSSQGRH